MIKCDLMTSSDKEMQRIFTHYLKLSGPRSSCKPSKLKDWCFGVTKIDLLMTMINA